MLPKLEPLGINMTKEKLQELHSKLPLHWSNSHICYTNIPANLRKVFELNFRPLAKALRRTSMLGTR